MLFLLRKIRRKLMQENKFTTYLLYAVGEIVLVMIGILLAVQIGEWNDGQLEKKEEVRTLLSLKEDFLQSRINVDSTLLEQSKVVRRLSKLNKILIIGDRSVSPDSLAEFVYMGAFSYWKVEPTKGTYDALISAGKIDLLKNIELKRLLAGYSAEIDYGFEDEAFSMDLTIRLVERSADYLPTISKNTHFQRYYFLSTDKIYSEGEVKSSVNKLMNDRKFLGVLVMKAAMESNRLVYQKSISSKLDQILELINQELALKNTN